MARITLRLNGVARTVDTDPATPLLYVLRDDLGCTARSSAAASASAAPAR